MEITPKLSYHKNQSGGAGTMPAPVKKYPEYKIAGGETYPLLEGKVNELIKQGFFPLGSMSQDDKYCAQPMIKYIN